MCVGMLSIGFLVIILSGLDQRPFIDGPLSGKDKCAIGSSVTYYICHSCLKFESHKKSKKILTLNGFFSFTSVMINMLPGKSLNHYISIRMTAQQIIFETAILPQMYHYKKCIVLFYGIAIVYNLRIVIES